MSTDIPSLSEILTGPSTSRAHWTRQCLDRLSSSEPRIHAFLSVNRQAMEQAEELDRATPAEGHLPLSGVPFSVKDLIATRDLPTTAGSMAPLEMEESLEAAVVEYLRSQGAILVGKTHLHEFAFGITSENFHFGPVRNPWNLERMSGGSSGGSAASVAVGSSILSLGTDTRGSIRIPAAHCGVCGLKPTFGALSTRGVFPLSPTLDHVGPLARRVEDLEMLYRMLRPEAGASDSPAVMRAGIAQSFLQTISPPVDSAFREAVDLLGRLGISVQPVETPPLTEVLEASDVISRAEALAVHEERLKRHGDLCDPSVRERLLSGRQLTAVELVRAFSERKRWSRQLKACFEGVDCLLAPTVPVTAPPLGTREIPWPGRPSESIVHCFVRLTAPLNMAGFPALTLPCGFDTEGMPIGMQIFADHDREDLLFRLGSLYQKNSDWHQRVPPEAGL